MRKILALFVLCTICLVPAAWAATSEQLVRHFEENQKWTNSALISFHVQKWASDGRIADMYDFINDKEYDYEGLIINGAAYQGKQNGPMTNLMGIIGNGVIAVLHKLATDENKNLFKPTWVGYHTPKNKRVSNWFCLIMGNHLKTYLTRVDQRSKLDEIGADPLQMNVLDKNLYNFEVVKDLGNRATLRVTPKRNADTNIVEAMIDLAQFKHGNAETWYATKITGKLTTGATGVTEFGNFRVAIAPAGSYIAYAFDNSNRGPVPVMDIAGALQTPAPKGDEKAFIFATQIKNTSYQTSRDVNEYEVKLITTVQRLHLNPSVEAMAQYIQGKRLGTLEKVAKKVVSSH